MRLRQENLPSLSLSLLRNARKLNSFCGEGHANKQLKVVLKFRVNLIVIYLKENLHVYF